MKTLSSLMSILVFSYLLLDFMSKYDQVSANVSIVEYSPLDSEANLEPIFPFEKAWRELRSAKKVSADIEKPVPKATVNSLTINNTNYVIYGIFSAQSNAQKNERSFVVLKPDGGDIKKVYLGEELESGFLLFSITSNSVTFKKENDLLEFKLFERKTNV